MKYLKKTKLEEIIFSTGGHHLSVYVEKKPSVKEMEKSLRKAIKDAREILEPVMAQPKLVNFLRPLYKLAKNPEALGSFDGNLAVFRKENSMRIISLPTAVEDLSIVASSFHVKPLLHWIQTSKDFLMVAFSLGSVRLYRGDCQSLRVLGVLPVSDLRTYNLSKIQRQDSQLSESILRQVTTWLQKRISELYGDEQPPSIFIAGPGSLTTNVTKRLEQKDIVPINYRLNRYIENAFAVADRIREILKLQSERESLDTIEAFKRAHHDRMTETRLAKIAQAAASGRIQSLLIAADVRIYGKYDPITGSLKLNPFHTDHEDDDVFDDIAQAVLDHGGHVHIANRMDIPDGNLAVAILQRRSIRPVLRTRSPSPSLTPTKGDFAIGF